MSANPRLRRRARERALQFLFGLDFTEYAWEPEVEGFWDANPSRPGVKRYTERLVRGVTTHQKELDAHLSEAMEHWSFDRIGYIERSVLRIALFEMLHADDVPPTVAINEAIEVTKRFGADDAPRFVNGVLDRIRRKVIEAEQST